MSAFRIAILVFSPGGNTFTAARMAAAALEERGFEVQLLDITAAKVITDREKLLQYLAQEIAPHDLLLVGGPVYENRLDKFTLRLIQQLPQPGNGPWGELCAPFVTWGGITSGISLHQAAKALRATGRKVVMAFKVEAFHVFSLEWPEPLNPGMPGEEALPLMTALADRVSEIAGMEVDALPDITDTLTDTPLLPKLVGAFTSRVPTQQYTYKGVKVDPDTCTGCGTCVRRCPLDRLEIREGKACVKADALRCMHCYTCLRVCPSGARRVGLAGMRGPLMGLRKLNNEHPGNALYTGGA